MGWGEPEWDGMRWDGTRWNGAGWDTKPGAQGIQGEKGLQHNNHNANTKAGQYSSCFRWARMPPFFLSREKRPTEGPDSQTGGGAHENGHTHFLLVFGLLSALIIAFVTIFWDLSCLFPELFTGSWPVTTNSVLGGWQVWMFGGTC